MSHIGQDSGISYQNLFKTMTQGVVYQNSEGKIIAVNKAAEKILSLTFCKKIRNDKGYWEQVDVYIHEHTEADISHGICPECMKEHYPEEYEDIKKTTDN